MKEKNSIQEYAIKIAIIDDDAEVRDGLCWMLNKTDGFICSGKYAGCSEAMKDLDKNPADVLLMDIGLPGKTGIECVHSIKKEYPGIEIIMLTVYSDDEKIFQSIKAGAIGYILKKTPTEKLISSISEASKGGAPMSPEIARKVLGYFKENSLSKISSKLSEREIQILEALIDGLSYKAIADKLFLSVHTVRFHLHNIYEKLHVKSRAEAVSLAIKNKFL